VTGELSGPQRQRCTPSAGLIMALVLLAAGLPWRDFFPGCFACRQPAADPRIPSDGWKTRRASTGMGAACSGIVNLRRLPRIAGQGLRLGPRPQGVSQRRSDRQLCQARCVGGRTPPMPRFQPDPQAMAILLDRPICMPSSELNGSGRPSA